MSDNNPTWEDTTEVAVEPSWEDTTPADSDYQEGTPVTEKDLQRQALKVATTNARMEGQRAAEDTKRAATLYGMVEPLTASGILNQPSRLVGLPDFFQEGKSIFGIKNAPEGPQTYATPTFRVGPYGIENAPTTVTQQSGTGVTAGLGRLATGVAQSFTTPEMAVTAPAAMESAIVRALFAFGMAKQLPEQVQHAYDVVSDPESTAADRVAAVGEPAVTAWFTKKIMGHGAPKIEIPDIPGVRLEKQQPAGALPPEPGTIFLDKVEQPPRIVAPEQKPAPTWEQEVVDAQRMVLYGTPKESAQALERLKVLRLEQERRFEANNPLQGTDQSTGFLQTAEQKLAERKQPVFEDTVPVPEKPAEAPVEAVPEKPEVAPVVPETPAEPTKGIITGRAIENWADDVLRGGATHAGPDVLAAYLVKGAALIERGIINFAEWSAEMIKQHGPEIEQHLKSIYEAAKATVSRAPESGTLKSAREIVEQRLSQQKPPTPTLPTATPTTTTPIVAALKSSPLSQVTLDDIYKIFEPVPKVKTPIKSKAVNIIEAVRTGLSSKFRPINKLAEDIAKSYGLNSRKDIAGIMEQLKGSRGKGEAQIYRFDRDVSSLVKGDEKDFNAYMFLQRSLDRLRMDQKDIAEAIAGGGPPVLNRRSVGQYTINDLEPKLAALEQKLGSEKLARFQQAASEYQRYMDDALKLQVESGRMSQDVYDAIKRDNQFYAPFKVMKYLQESMRPEGTGAKIDTVADYTKAMKGIEDPNFKLGDMLGAARQSILISRILADKATAMRNVADLAKIDTQELFIKKLNTGQEPPEGWQTVNVFEDGRKVRYATRPEVADALQLYGGSGGGIISNLLSIMSVPFKAGATALNIPFQFSNLLADIPRQALVSKYGIKGVKDLIQYPWDLARAIYSSMSGDLFGRENKLFLDFLDSGAAGVTVQEHLTPKALEFREPSTMSKAKRIALNIIYSPAEFAAAIEQTSKILGVERAMRIHGVKSGAELAKQIPEAITELRRFSGSPDFGRQGKFVETARLNLLYMFLNARIQGAVADVGRLTGRDGAKLAATTWFKVATAVGIPTAYLYYMNNSATFKDDYDKRPQNEKNNYWLIPKSTFITNDQGEQMRDYWRIPKRESAKWIANMTESALNFAQKRDPKSFGNFGQQMLEDISPVNIQGNTAQERLESVGASLNPIIKAPLETATGRDMFRHRQLIPDAMKKASPEQQYTDRTAEAFKKLAVAMPDVAPEFLRSPIMLENLTRNMTAGLLTQFLSSKPVEGRTPTENMALLQRFQAVPYTDNEAFTKEVQALERESTDQYLARNRAATKIMEDNKGKSLPEMIKSAGNDPKLMQQVVDLWVAKQNGATYQDKRLISLPAKQRAEYVAKILAPLSGEEKQKKILELAKRRVLTEQVFQEMSQLPK